MEERWTLPQRERLFGAKEDGVLRLLDSQEEVLLIRLTGEIPEDANLKIELEIRRE